MQKHVREFQSGSVKGLLHFPEGAISQGLVLTHGAGGNSRSPLLVSIAEVFASRGLAVLRYDLPYRQRKPFGPPFGTAEEDRKGLRDAVNALRSSEGLGRVFLGGHSYGGRQASILAVEEPVICDGLLLFSYPLHPPQRPHQLRTEHFRELHTGAVFVHGSKDPFGSIEELKAAAGLIPGRTKVEEIEGAGHDLGKGKLNLGDRITQAFASMFDCVPGKS